MATRYLCYLAIIGTAVSQVDTLKCMNFYGLETERAGLVCDWAHPPEWYLQQLQDRMGIDTIRLPFSYHYVTTSDMLKMDHFIGECQRLGLRVILDYHRTLPTHQGPSPEEGISMDTFVDAWLRLLRRYAPIPVVYGVGVFNEIQSPDDFTYTTKMHRRVIAAVENEFPGRFYFFCGCPGWGGDCSLMDLSDMDTWNRTYVEVHKYKFSGVSTRPGWDKSIPANISSDHWFVGETGWLQQDAQWAAGFIAYLRERNIRSVCGWTIAHSGDTGGWWQDDCVTFDSSKADLLTSLWVGRRRMLRANGDFP